MLDGPREKKDPDIFILNNWVAFGIINKNRVSGEKGIFRRMIMRFVLDSNSQNHEWNGRGILKYQDEEVLVLRD